MNKSAPGRNDPCPCGSGKKYKKCCLDKGIQAQAKPPFEPTPDIPSPRRNGGGLHVRAYTIAKMATNPNIYNKYCTPEEIEVHRNLWSPEKLAQMSTEEIESRLCGLGISYSREALLKLIQGQTSAFDASHPWGNQVEHRKDRSEDFVGLAVCELWKRLAPEPPSVEMLDDWMQEGYAHSKKGQPEQACKIWLKTWDTLRRKFTPEMTDPSQANERIFWGMTYNLGNWISDFGMECLNAARSIPVCAEIGIRFHKECMHQFTVGHNALMMRGDLGTILYISGNVSEGEQMFQKLMDEFPEKAIGYVHYADALTDPDRKTTRPDDLQKAIALLEQALARPVEDAEDYDVDSRLKELRQRIQ